MLRRVFLGSAQHILGNFCAEEQQFWYYNGKHKKAHSGEELTIFVRVYKKATPKESLTCSTFGRYSQTYILQLLLQFRFRHLQDF